MYKLKTIKSIGKRFKVTHTKKFLRRQACKNHLLEKKSTNRKRKLRKLFYVSVSDKCNFKNSLPYR
uniref:Large ribosomal subunit protein bL35c n=1 Tax=Bostrychia simpliciuscula TaxID=324754 RepID=A0A1Z1M808_9FLOR|nr:ribosomal protein L35 [Bostrychia simpliciuscula]ARW62099.1 ribosomal protein L35 [Bostrychia simpliciuscula]